ncbi:MAG: PSD1 and planctomycete cytochrome C domain-containing protein [Planctomycetota bacterium]
MTLNAAQLSIVLVLLSGLGSRLLADSTAEGIEFFESRIRPVLAERCYKCHSARSKKLKAGLRVDARRFLLRGGDTGASIVPGKPHESLLIESLLYDDRSYQMPPDGRLPKSQIDDFIRWVELGAPWPDEDAKAVGPSKEKGVITAESRNFWSFRPVQRVSPPEVRDASGAQNAIDRFILRRLEERNLKLAERAAPRDLIRRVTYDLTGLPPEPEAVEAFVANPSQEAYAQLVDRLLSSSSYGERWARHWLDGVRYVSDAGYYNFSDLGWRYRDWVVRALNDDLPFDRFVRMQIAGDLLSAETDEDYADGITATGVLAMGNIDDQESDREKLFANVIDDQIDLVTRQFLGLTVSCARCHDHKFDPIPTSDYYALGGIFLSSKVLSTKGRIGAPRLKISLNRPDWKERRKKQEAELARMRGELETLERSLESSSLANALRSKIADAVWSLPRDRGETIGAREGAHLNGRHKSIGNMRLYIRGNPFKLGKEVPRGVLSVLSPPGGASIAAQSKQSGRLELAGWIASPENPLTARVMVNRVWLYHFGQGIVRTPSNFGTRGERPSHPELLDHLAAELVASSWSLKQLHRSIVLSATYQQSTHGDPKTERSDPENRLFGRFFSRRLSAEEIHDSLLAISERLQPKLGQGRGNRALYARVGHEHSSLVSSLFDAPPIGTMTAKRDESTTAPQALFMMNDPAVIQTSRAFARLIERSGADDAGAIRSAYRIAYGRKPRDEEMEKGRAFLRRVPRAERWAYFHVLLCTNEWIYVR